MILTASWKLPEQFLEAQGANSSAGAFSVFCNIISVVNLFFFFFYSQVYSYFLDYGEELQYYKIRSNLELYYHS